MASGSDERKLTVEVEQQLVELPELFAESVVVVEPDYVELELDQLDQIEQHVEILGKLQKAKKDGLTVKLSYTNIAITGSAAAGKTSFLNLLHTKKFVAVHDSTNVAESKHVFCVKLTGVVESKWVDLSYEMMLKQLHEFLDKHVKADIFQFVSSMNSEGHGGKCSVEENIAASRTFGIQPLGAVWNMINFIDTGGQPECINLLPAINSSIALTFVVLNMCGGVKSLDEQVLAVHSKSGKQSFEPYHLHYTNLDLIKRFMVLAKESSLKREPPISPVKQRSTSHSHHCFVGTHADKVRKQEIQAIDNKLKCVTDELKCNEFLWEFNDNVLFPVDNTTAGSKNEDAIAEKIRLRIQQLVESNSIYDVPVTWFILFLEMQRKWSELGTNFVSYKEAVAICEQGNLMTTHEDVQSALLFFHYMGVLLYYPEVPGMCQYVIINHQWLFDKLTSLVTMSFERVGFDLKAITNFKNEGLLTKSLVQQIKLESDISLQHFVDLLVHLKVIAKIDEETFFMPCVLSSFQPSTSTILDRYGHLHSMPLLVQFFKSPIPRGFFCCLAVQIYQNLPKNWEVPLQSSKYRQHTYSNLITFHTSDTGHAISLIDKVGYLEIQLRHEENDPPPIHYATLCNLTTAIQKVCDHLQLDNKRVRYGFYCNCRKEIIEDDTHIASLPSNLDPAPHSMRCDHNKTKLTSAHLMWLEPAKHVKLPSSHLSSDTEVRVVTKQSLRSLELEVLNKVYHNLQSGLPIEDILPKLVSKLVITITDKTKITQSGKTANEKSQFLLDHYICKQLLGGDSTGFYSLLQAMQETSKCTLLVDKIKNYLKEGNDELIAATERIDVASTDNVDELPELCTLTAFYEKLCHVIPVDDLLPNLVALRVITTNDKSKITASGSTQFERNQCLLDHYIGRPLSAGDPNFFYALLGVMISSPKCNFLVVEMNQHLSTAREHQKFSSTGQSNPVQR